MCQAVTETLFKRLKYNVGISVILGVVNWKLAICLEDIQKCLDISIIMFECNLLITHKLNFVIVARNPSRHIQIPTYDSQLHLRKLKKLWRCRWYAVDLNAVSFEAPSGFVQQFRHLRYLPGQKQLQLVRLFTTVVVVDACRP